MNVHRATTLPPQVWPTPNFDLDLETKISLQPSKGSSPAHARAAHRRIEVFITCCHPIKIDTVLCVAQNVSFSSHRKRTVPLLSRQFHTKLCLFPILCSYLCWFPLFPVCFYFIFLASLFKLSHGLVVSFGLLAHSTQLQMPFFSVFIFSTMSVALLECTIGTLHRYKKKPPPSVGKIRGIIFNPFSAIWLLKWSWIEVNFLEEHHTYFTK